MPIKSFRDLVVWQRAMTLVEHVYAATEHFPVSERYGLVAQLRKAAVSIPSNIAEGHARRTGHFRHHVNIALGSEAELQTQLELAYRLKLAPKAQVQPILDEAADVGRLLHGLERALAARL